MGNTIARQALGSAMALVLAFGMCVPNAAAHAASELAAADATTTASTVDDTFTFSDDGISQTGTSDAKISGTELTIKESGTYLITGSAAAGSVKVKNGTTGVSLVLQDLSLATSSGAPLAINKNNGDVTVQIDGTVTLTDNENADDENSTDKEVADAFEGAAIKVKSGSNLTITGTGTLTADGSACKNGIKGGAGSSITIGTSASDAITVNAKAAKNGIASDGSVVVNGGTVTVEAGNDGIKSEPDEDDTTSAGTVTVNGGTVSITSAGDGIQTTGALDVEDGAIAITAGGGSDTKFMSTDDSCKGLKSDTRVVVNGGTFNLNTADDCVHSDGNVDLYGGTFTLQTHNNSTKPDNMNSSQASTTTYEKGGDAVHADYVTTIGKDGVTSTPVITAEKCYEGIEGAEVNVAGGTVKVTAADDGINAANSDLTGHAYKVTISGGDVLVNASGDGIDSNGTADFTGGKIEVYSSATNGAEEAIDCDGDWTVSGAQLLAVGGTGVDWKVPASGVYVNFGATGGMGGFGQGGMNQNGMGNMGQIGMGDGNNAGTGFTGGPSGNGQQGFQQGGSFDQSGQLGQGGMNDRGGFDGRRFNTMDASDESSTEGEFTTQAMGARGGTGGTASGSTIIQSGQTVVVKDSSNNELYSTTATGTGTTAFFAHPLLTSGETYTMTVGGSSSLTGTAAQGSSSSAGPGTFPGGNLPGNLPGDQPSGQPTDVPSGNLPGNPPSGQPATDQQPGNPPATDQTPTDQIGDNQQWDNQPPAEQPNTDQKPPANPNAETDSNTNTATETDTKTDANAETSNGQKETSGNTAIDNRVDLSNAQIASIPKQGYTGKEITPKTVVTIGGTTLVQETDYTVSYLNNKKRGTATAVVTATENSAKYKGSTSKDFSIVKGTNTIKVAAATKTIAQSKVKSSSKKLKALYVTNAKGTVKYTRVSGSKYLKVNSKGKIVVAKGTPTGTYKVKVKVRAAGTSNFKAKTVTKTVKVTVR